MIIQETLKISISIFDVIDRGVKWFAPNSSPPTSYPNYGDAYFNTVFGFSFVYDGSNWVPLT